MSYDEFLLYLECSHERTYKNAKKNIERYETYKKNFNKQQRMEK